MTDLIIPEEFKKLSGKGATVGQHWLVRRCESGYELLNTSSVMWKEVAGTWALIAVFGAVGFEVAEQRGGSTPPAFLPWLFFIGTFLMSAGILAFQVHTRKTNSPWLLLDEAKREIVLLEGSRQRVPFDHVRRVHLASELVGAHGDGGRYRSFELSLLVRDEEDSPLKRVPVISGLDRKLMLEVSVCLQKGVGLRLGSVEDRVLDQELEEDV